LRRQETGDRRQETENRRQKTDDRWQTRDEGRGMRELRTPLESRDGASNGARGPTNIEYRTPTDSVGQVSSSVG